MTKKTLADVRRDFTLNVTLAFDAENGLEFGYLAMLNKLVAEEKKRNPDKTDKQILGSVLSYMVSFYTDHHKDEDWNEDTWAEGQTQAYEKYKELGINLE